MLVQQSAALIEHFGITATPQRGLSGAAALITFSWEHTRASVEIRKFPMNVDFAVVSDYALVDQAGKISVLGIFQHIWVQQFPAMHPRLHLVLRLKGKRTEIGEHPVQIRLVDDRDTEILGGSGTVNFAEPPAGVTDIEARGHFWSSTSLSRTPGRTGSPSR